MNYQKLESYCDQGLSGREIAAKENVSQPTVSYWIKKHGLKKKKPSVRVCPCCSITKDNYDFYIRKRDSRPYGSCISCIKEKDRRRKHQGKELKRLAVEKLGGCCGRCGLSFDFEVYDFHHLRDKKFKLADQFKRYSEKLRLGFYLKLKNVFFFAETATDWNITMPNT